MTYDEAVAFLDSRIRWGMRPGTERIAALMSALADPQHSYPVVHVSGTNGKYSVAAMTARILEALGHTTGMYTSPHVEDLSERIALAGEPIPAETFAATLQHLLPYIDALERERGDHLTYFETFTAIAFEAFFDRAVHVAVVETGLGGEYDATNVADAAVAVITRVALDHVVEFEGSLEKAAWEKAGIIKAGSAVVSGVRQPELSSIVADRAADRGAAALWQLGSDVTVEGELALGGQIVTVRTPRTVYEGVFLPLHGQHQADNAALAIAAAEAFCGDEPLDADVVREALWELRLPGRLEVVGRHPLVVLDVGHNPDAAEAAVRALRESFTFRRAVCVVGMLEDKLVEDVLAVLAGAFERFIVTAPSEGRAAEPERLMAGLAAAGAGERSSAVEGVASALRTALGSADAEDLVFVFGSFYTVGEARSWLREQGLLPQA